jgi:hypothetical protein
VTVGPPRCQDLFHQLHAKELEEWSTPYAVHRLMVDTYCLQHPDAYCVSAKSLAAHLTGVCWALERGGHPSGLRALQQWLDGRVSLVRPDVPSFRGALTVGDVARAADAEAYVSALGRWARSTWGAYRALHPVAREWIERAV